MTQFKSGDRVKIISSPWPDQIGKRGTVISIHETLPARPQDSSPQVGPFYGVLFDETFDGDRLARI